ncbi:MAG: plasmid mobilization relaxosome protein MobC [Eubacteriales bacterium]|nr:plasmid mobilization relaxosome protein MobC [Eubacteriales bacterium]
MRNHKITVRLNDTEFALLKTNVKRSGLSQEGYIRHLIHGRTPREKPDDRFYVVMRQLAGLGNNCHQLLKKANALGFIDTPLLKSEAEKWAVFRLEMQQRYLHPEKVGDVLSP